MILDNEITVDAAPDQVFTLLRDVERVATCLPGAVLEGRDGDVHTGRVTVKVGPITAAYAGTVRFLEVDPAQRLLRLQARGADVHGSGDAEAEVIITVGAADTGSVLRTRTDLLIRGKIAQFGKSAIAAVSNRLLREFAANLAGLLGAPVSTVTPVRADATGQAELDGVSLLFGPAARKYAPLAGAFALGVLQGWLLGKVRTQARLIKELRRG